MSTTKTYSYMEMERILRKNGYKYISTKGDHCKFTDGKKTIVICKRNPNKLVMQRLLKENNLKI